MKRTAKDYLEGAEVSTFLSGVYMWMTLGLVFTGIFSTLFAYNPDLLSTIIYTEVIDGVEDSGFTFWGWVALLSPILFVLIMIRGMDKFSFSTLAMLFITYASVTGISLSVIFLVYTESSIMLTFAITAGMFFIMSIIGYTTKTDLTKLGNLLLMALIGLILAMVINMFMRNEMMDYIISGIAVIVFTALIAYDTQKLKNIGSGINAYSEDGKKQALMGALSLYLDFINLFLHLLQFFGGSKD